MKNNFFALSFENCFCKIKALNKSQELNKRFDYLNRSMSVWNRKQAFGAS